MTKIDARETTKRSLKKYTSDQLIKKLEGGKLLSLSKELAFEILKDREVELPDSLKDGSPEPVKKKKAAPKAKVEKKEDAPKDEKKETAPKAKAEKSGGTRDVSNENPDLVVGTKVSFEQRVSKDTVTGKIISFYDWTTKKDVTKEAANISVEVDGKAKKFVKNVSALTKA